MEIGAVVRRRRKALGMNLAMLAEQIGSDPGNLSRIERGQQDYTPSWLEAVATALNTTVSEIVAEAEMPNSRLKTSDRQRMISEEQEMLAEYRRLRGSARGIVRLIIAEMVSSAHHESNSQK